MELYKDYDYLYREFIVNRRSAKNIANELSVNDSRIEYYLGSLGLYGIRTRIKNTCDESTFDLTSPIFNYYSGLIATDGYIDTKNNRVSLRMKNSGVLQVLVNLKNYFKFTGEIREYNKSYDLTITSHLLITKLLEMGLTLSNKSFDVRFPTNFYSDICAKMYFRGILDGDGNIQLRKGLKGNYTGGQFRIAKGSVSFISGITNFVNEKFNCKYEVKFAKIRNSKYPLLQMRVDDSLALYNWIYGKNLIYPEYKLPDKYESYLKLLR